ncbi:M56 family metallopeptidase [Microseira wollei]|uniref:Peptidase M48 domain-containing protein n=1 Tax=Microseira wollei NIES-4236 TaxID=2530354 RepID=A0AAV3XDN4_9CYAN|nr:M56 family metallopeptidase [Microseira wollei]GET40353.1 hypothetical protein MiSe_51620 [Microseira wollei NIES-4236]
MHLIIILAALLLAWYLRLQWSDSAQNWAKRWQCALLCFALPPLLLIITAASILCMGPNGYMADLDNGLFSYFLALGFAAWALVKCLQLAFRGYGGVQQIRASTQTNIGDKSARILDTSALFSAQIGFWQPELVVSQGLLQKLDMPHLEAVLAHEQGHYYYRDTFWFFWLGWLRSFTSWLPNTEALWEELLALRELRADRWAANRVDPLLLAESLLFVASDRVQMVEHFCAAFSQSVGRNRLQERIEALLTPDASPGLNWWDWSWLLLAFVPLFAVPFHG